MPQGAKLLASRFTNATNLLDNLAGAGFVVRIYTARRVGVITKVVNSSKYPAPDSIVQVPRIFAE